MPPEMMTLTPFHEGRPVKSGPVSGIWDKLLAFNLIVFGLKDGKALTMTEMFRYQFAFTCDCDFHDTFLLYRFILIVSLT